MDNPSQESTAPLNVESAAAAFSSLLEPPREEQQEDAPQVEAVEDKPAEVEAQDGQTEEAGDTFTIEVDGKEVTLTKADLAEAYKNGLRQSDYTKKTMEVAEQRKAAESEVAKARQERETYAANLQKMAAQLEGALVEQQNIDWQALLESDPQEYLKQRHLYEQRQAAYQQNQQRQAHLSEQAKAEQAAMRQSYLAEQRENLLAKLPDWKDPAKASAEQQAIAKYLQEQGFEGELIAQVADHRQVLVARKAMLYDQMVAKANAAAKKVQALPQKVVKPGVGERPGLDGRSSAMQKLSKSGKVEDAAAAIAHLFN